MVYMILLVFCLLSEQRSWSCWSEQVARLGWRYSNRINCGMDTDFHRFISNEKDTVLLMLKTKKHCWEPISSAFHWWIWRRVWFVCLCKIGIRWLEICEWCIYVKMFSRIYKEGDKIQLREKVLHRWFRN